MLPRAPQNQPERKVSLVSARWVGHLINLGFVSSQVFVVQDVRVDSDARRVWRGEDEVELSRMEFRLLHHLIANAGRIVSKDELMRSVWDTSFYSSAKTVDVHLGWLRRKLGEDVSCPRLITTVRGKGLRFELEFADTATSSGVGAPEAVH